MPGDGRYVATPRKTRRWVKDRYFSSYKGASMVSQCAEKNRRWSEASVHVIGTLGHANCCGHIKIKAAANPPTPLGDEYFESAGAKEESSLPRKGRAKLYGFWVQRRSVLRLLQPGEPKTHRWHSRHIVKLGHGERRGG